jgi:hypothetical protein
MTTPSGDANKHQTEIGVDVVVSKATRIPKEELKGYKPFVGFPKLPVSEDTNAPPTTDAPPG